MTVKKAYIELIEFLEENAQKKVATVMDEVIAMCSAKTGGGGGKATTFHRVGDQVVAIKDFYFKKWLPVEHFDFGAKKSSATGLNSMCKEGVSKWTKQQAAYKKGKEELLDLVASGELSAADVPAKLEELEKTKDAIQPFDNPEDANFAFDTLEECLAHLGIDMPETGSDSDE